jgi:trimeric autotransporter adhesin
MGFESLFLNTTGASNTAMGLCALNTTGCRNVAVGANVLDANTSGLYNTGVGYSSLTAATTGDQNAAFGINSGNSITDGVGNTLIGSDAGKNIVAGGGNTVLGSLKPDGVYSPPYDITGSENNRIVLGSTTVTNAYVKVAWTVTSDARDKMNIESVPHGLDFVNQLNPIKYNFKKSRDDETPHGSARYGFKAQDILALEGENPIIIDNENEDSLKYNGEALVPVLVNAIKELKAEIELLKNK